MELECENMNGSVNEVDCESWICKYELELECSEMSNLNVLV